MKNSTNIYASSDQRQQSALYANCSTGISTKPRMKEKVQGTLTSCFFTVALRIKLSSKSSGNFRGTRTCTCEKLAELGWLQGNVSFREKLRAHIDEIVHTRTKNDNMRDNTINFLKLAESKCLKSKSTSEERNRARQRAFRTQKLQDEANVTGNTTYAEFPCRNMVLEIHRLPCKKNSVSRFLVGRPSWLTWLICRW